ncbi:MAG: hypothetical protein LC657_16450 [Desulfobacteraceae bacterium]|nr:hypothetical protein [Desulfobacteraceae bacterium]
MINLYLNRFEGMSRSVFFLDWGFSIILVGSVRLAVRIIFEQFTQEVRPKDFFHMLAKESGKI